jgi:hypothetical protein
MVYQNYRRYLWIFWIEMMKTTCEKKENNSFAVITFHQTQLWWLIQAYSTKYWPMVKGKQFEKSSFVVVNKVIFYINCLYKMHCVDSPVFVNKCQGDGSFWNAFQFLKKVFQVKSDQISIDLIRKNKLTRAPQKRGNIRPNVNLFEESRIIIQ